jgi:hypothetical protein
MAIDKNFVEELINVIKKMSLNGAVETLLP